MIILVPEKSIVKKGNKWVRPKDFIIADATQDSGNEVSAMGQRVRADEFSPTPTLMKIALDPDSAESKIKKRNFQKYLDNWLDDISLNTRLNFLMSAVIKNWKEHGEDLNVFIVFQKVAYREYASFVQDHIIDIYGEGTALLLTHKMEKETIANILNHKYSNEFMEEVKRRVKRIGKDLAKDGIDPKNYLNTDED